MQKTKTKKKRNVSKKVCLEVNAEEAKETGGIIFCQVTAA
jgi:hypothetical protein